MVVVALSEDDVDRIFHALADATRRDIVRRAITGEHSISELARRYPMSLTAVQKHVAVLEDAGLVVKRRHGREQHVMGQHDALALAQRLLDDYERLWHGRFDRMSTMLDEDRGGGTA
jgi:DNA-binding transcriptional ArsR family regulator